MGCICVIEHVMCQGCMVPQRYVKSFGHHPEINSFSLFVCMSTRYNNIYLQLQYLSKFVTKQFSRRKKNECVLNPKIPMHHCECKILIKTLFIMYSGCASLVKIQLRKHCLWCNYLKLKRLLGDDKKDINEIEK